MSADVTKVRAPQAGVRMKAAVALLALALLAGCGKKGAPEPLGPPSEVIYPHSYPSR